MSTAPIKYSRGMHPNSRNGFKSGHPKYPGCGAPAGRHNSPATEFKAGQPSPFKGARLTAEHRAKLSAAKLGRPAPHKAGANCPFWKGGITPVHLALRTSREYINWRRKVFERDNYTCVQCGQRGGRLQADHIKPFARYPELRFDVSNGRTLCRPCHAQTETYGRNGNAKG